MNKTFKIILIVSIILNLVFIISLATIGIKAISFKHHWENYFKNEYFRDEDDDHRHKDRYKSKRKGRHGRNWIGKEKHPFFSSLIDNSEIKGNLQEMRLLKNNVKQLLAKDDMIELKKIAEVLNQLETNIITITKITHQELLESLKGMKPEERRKSIEFFFKKTRF